MQTLRVQSITSITLHANPNGNATHEPAGVIQGHWVLHNHSLESGPLFRVRRKTSDERTKRALHRMRSGRIHEGHAATVAANMRHLSALRRHARDIAAEGAAHILRSVRIDQQRPTATAYQLTLGPILVWRMIRYYCSRHWVLALLTLPTRRIFTWADPALHPMRPLLEETTTTHRNSTSNSNSTAFDCTILQTSSNPIQIQIPIQMQSGSFRLPVRVTDSVTLRTTLSILSSVAGLMLH